MTRFRPVEWAVRAALACLSARPRLRRAARAMLRSSPLLARLAGGMLAGAQADMVRAARAGHAGGAVGKGFGDSERLHRTARAIVERNVRP